MNDRLRVKRARVHSGERALVSFRSSEFLETPKIQTHLRRVRYLFIYLSILEVHLHQLKTRFLSQF